MSKARITLLSVVALAAVATVAWAQATGTVKGSVVSATNGQAIAGARCTVGPKAVTTDGKGSFSVEVPAGAHTVRCAAALFQPASRTVSVQAGKSTSVVIKLKGAKADLKKAEEAERFAPAADAAAAPVTRAMLGVGGLGVRGTGSGGGGKGYGRGAIGLKRKIRSRGPMRRPPPRPRPQLVIAGDAAPQPEASREAYDKLTDNPFKSALKDPLSTFSIDVDTASYANVRRFINDGKLPPADAVRIEELLNYFQYDYPDAKGPHPFSVTTEVSVAPWNPKHRLVHIGLQGKKIDTSELPPSNLVFLLDVSGSMNNANKLPLLKAAFRLLVNNLGPKDRVAIVVYAGAAGQVLGSTSGAEKGTILAALEGLRAGGSTAGGAGIQLAYKIAQENFIKGGNNRIILATDGDFNVGTSSDGELQRLIEEKRKTGVFLTILGFGRGNYQDAKMEKLSNAGNGNAAYIDSILEAQKVLVTEMGGTLLTIAKDVKLQLEFNPAKVKGYRLIGYENRILAAQDFNDDKKDAGEMGAGHSVTALYEIIPAGSPEEIPGVDALKYQKTGVTEAAQNSPELLTVKLRYKQPDGDKSTLMTQPLIDQDLPMEKTSADFRWSTAVAELGLILRDSKYKGDASFDALIKRAKAAMGEDDKGYRFDFIGLAKKARMLHQAKAPAEPGKTPLKMAK